MKITPKFQRGGGFDQFFTTYTPVEIQSQQGRSSQQSSRQTDRSEESTKGRLTEKDFFEMIKDIDGLPNEMNALVTNLMNTFQLDRMSGQSTGDLATKYLSNLYQIKTLAQNKKKYDEAVATAQKNGAMAEPAISMDGKLIVQNKENGSLNAISIDKYYKNRDDYAIITVSNLANMRAYSPSLARSQEAIDIINNSMGYEAFQELLSKSTQTLGSSEITRNGLFSAEGQASKGLELLQQLSNDDRVQALGSVTAQGLYEYKIIDKSQLNQINALTSYITQTLPDRAKTWAAIKTGQTDKNQATRELVLKYLLGRSTNSHLFDIQYKGDINNPSKTSQKGSYEDPKKGFWSQVQSGHGGDDFRFTLLNKNGSMSIDSKFYGTTPGLDSNKSLGDYINSSNMGYIIKNNKNITFGDKKISVDSFNDVMVNAYSGMSVTTLPIKADGTVDFNFNHMLSQVKFTFTNTDSRSYTLKISEIKIENAVKTATGTYTASSIDWDGEATGTYTFADIADIAEDGTHAVDLFVIPQRNSNLNVSFKASFYDATALAIQTPLKEGTFTANLNYDGAIQDTEKGNWTPGFRYNYTVEVNADDIDDEGKLTKIDFKVTDVDTWESTGDTSITPQQ